MDKISVVIPMYYEEQVAKECYRRVTESLMKIRNYDYEIIFVNDGSKDKTLSILESFANMDEKVKIISFSRNFGHQAAVTAGLKYTTGDAVVISIAILIYSILSYALKWNNLTAGWTSIMCTMTFLGGVILISLWMIGEYIARIYDEAKERPQYIIEKTINI